MYTLPATILEGGKQQKERGVAEILDGFVM